jgi:Leucine-rich repeat (LRR) protein
LTHLPLSIGQLVNLTWLNLERGPLETLPEEVGNLRALERLDVDYCKLVRLSHIVERLPRLKKLGWGGNHFPEPERQALVTLHKQRGFE